MIFCRRCGRYSAEPASACEACGADLKLAGHTTFQGGAVKLGAVGKSSTSAAAAATAVALAPAPEPKPEPVAEPFPESQAEPELQPQLEALPESAPASFLNPVFDRDKFLLRQKAIAINEKYYVTDEAGTPLVFVEKPAMDRVV